MATPNPTLEDVGPEDDSEAVRTADRPPSDWQIVSVYDKLNQKLTAGMTLPYRNLGENASIGREFFTKILVI